MRKKDKLAADIILLQLVIAHISDGKFSSQLCVVQSKDLLFHYCHLEWNANFEILISVCFRRLFELLIQ